MKHNLSYYLDGGYSVEIIEEHGAKGKTYVARLIAMPACLGQGNSEAEARANLKLVRDAYFAARHEHGAPLPEPDHDRAFVEEASLTITSGGSQADVWTVESFGSKTLIGTRSDFAFQ